jgi:hypothetical protein
MAKIPPLRRISAEDFKEQSDWIDNLLAPVNDYFERSTSALNRALTINDNFAGEIRTVDVDGRFPIKIAWTLGVRPASVFVGNVYRADGLSMSMPTAVSVQWQFNQAGQLQIDAFPGLLPPSHRFYDGDVSTANDTIGLPSHGYATGDKVVLYTAGVLPTGLSAATSYYVIKSSDHLIKLATTPANATAGTAINITAAAGGGQHIVTPEYRYKYKVVLNCLTG